ncbi:hypothetical protein Tco_0211986, partial [Tanacetum coccineum]
MLIKCWHISWSPSLDVDGITHANPEGLATTFGKWGSVVAARLQGSGLSCK